MNELTDISWMNEDSTKEWMRAGGHDKLWKIRQVWLGAVRFDIVQADL
jgi:hypothetical protein